jgi:hypothetical protein
VGGGEDGVWVSCNDGRGKEVIGNEPEVIRKSRAD